MISTNLRSQHQPGPTKTERELIDGVGLSVGSSVGLNWMAGWMDGRKCGVESELEAGFEMERRNQATPGAHQKLLKHNKLEKHQHSIFGSMEE